MRYAIISDIHANLEALSTVLRALSLEKIDRYLCVGDIVGYGAEPEQCIERTLELDPVVVQGNHDIASADLSGINSFNDIAREAAIWTHKKLSEKYKQLLKKLPLVYKNRFLTMAHGTLHEPQNFHYMLDRHAAILSFDNLKTKICFVGHSHVPGIFTYKGDLPEYFYSQTLKLEKSKKYIANVGSVGQPRDGDPRACYCIYDKKNSSLEIRRVAYNVKKAQKKILAAGLPPYLAHRLGDGV